MPSSPDAPAKRSGPAKAGSAAAKPAGGAKPAGAGKPAPAAPPRQVRLRRLAGLAALAAGACWLVKSAAILATGAQPAHVFELAPALQSVAVAGMAFGFPVRAARRAVALLAVVPGLAAVALHLAMPEHLLVNAAILAATLLVLAALFLVGGTLRAQRALGRWSGLPRAIGLWTVPLVIAGGLLSVAGERLLEVPLLLLAVAWLWLGGLLLVPRAPRRAA